MQLTTLNRCVFCALDARAFVRRFCNGGFENEAFDFGWRRWARCVDDDAVGDCSRHRASAGHADEGASLFRSIQLVRLLRRYQWRWRVGPFRFLRAVCLGFIRHIRLARRRYDWLQLADWTGCLRT